MERGDPSVTIDLLLRGLILLGVTRTEIAKILVFEEPRSLVLSQPVKVAATGDSTKPFAWYQFPGRSVHGSIKTGSSGTLLPVRDLINMNEVTYG